MRSARVPMGGWAEDGEAAPRRHEPLPEESSEDEIPPHIHKVKAVGVAGIFYQFTHVHCSEMDI